MAGLAHFTFPSRPPSAMLGFGTHKFSFENSKLVVTDGHRRAGFQFNSVAPLVNMWFANNTETYPTTYVCDCLWNIYIYFFQYLCSQVQRIFFTTPLCLNLIRARKVIWSYWRKPTINIPAFYIYNCCISIGGLNESHQKGVKIKMRNLGHSKLYQVWQIEQVRQKYSSNKSAWI